MIWRIKKRIVHLDSKGIIMGVLNVTPDSFSDGGKFYRHEDAIARGLEMLAQGADIIDVGGESTRPGAREIDAEEEKKRVLPVIRGILQEKPEALISIDTFKAIVARQAIDAGASIINDITGLRGDKEMLQVAAETEVGVVIMHMQGTPSTMQRQPHYNHVVAEVKDFFSTQCAVALQAGIAFENIVFDPGIGFGKEVEHNLQLLKNLDQLVVEERPLLLGVSRKSFLGKILQSEIMKERSAPTVGITAYAREKGVSIFRVHDIKENVTTIQVMDRILNSTE